MHTYMYKYSSPQAMHQRLEMKQNGGKKLAYEDNLREYTMNKLSAERFFDEKRKNWLTGIVGEYYDQTVRRKTSPEALYEPRY